MGRHSRQRSRADDRDAGRVPEGGRGLPLKRARSRRRRALVVAVLLGTAALVVQAPAAAEKVVVDLDIGDDIDDAFALALVLASPELEVVGIGTTAGDTALRVRLVRRFLHEAGRDDIPVAQGIATAPRTPFTQARWASRGPDDGKPVAASVDLLLDVAARHPGEVTLLALGPLTNVAAAVARDPARFARFKRIVMMGGSIRRGYGKSDYGPASPAAHEYNIVSDPSAARTVFAAGVPIDLFPLDATQVRLDDAKRNELFAHGTPVTDALTLLYHQWQAADAPWVGPIPTLFDIVPIAWLLDPASCPTVAMHVTIGDDGSTVETAGPPNARVCLQSDAQRVLDLTMRRLLAR